jgi:branched-chain amino acid transport system permease protein
VFHLAHGTVIVISAYVFWWLWVVQGWHPVLAGIGSCVVAALVGLGMNEFVYEPLRKRKTKGLGYMVASIAMLEFGGAFVLAVFGSQPRSLGVETTVYTFLDARISALQIFILILAVVLLALTAWILKKTRFGKAMRATADNEEVAEILGVKTRSVRRMTFAIGSVLGAVAGIMTALEFNVDPNMGVNIALKGFTAMVMGGVGSMPGALAGSALLGGVEQGAVWYWGSGWKNAMAFVLLFVFLLVRPQGMFGRKKVL